MIINYLKYKSYGITVHAVIYFLGEATLVRSALNVAEKNLMVAQTLGDYIARMDLQPAKAMQDSNV